MHFLMKNSKKQQAKVKRLKMTRASWENDTRKEVQFCPRAEGPRARIGLPEGVIFQ